MTPYNKGKAAYAQHIKDDANPFKGGEKRRWWFDGWYDARIVDKLGAVFARHGIEW